MAISLKISTDFEQAERDLKNFSGFTESEVKRIQKYAESFKTEQIDKFISKQERNKIALMATRGELAANQIEYNNMQREIERLINKGLSPTDAVLKPLISRYSELGDRITQTKDKTEALRIKTEQETKALEELGKKSVDVAKNSLLALGAAVVAVAGISIKSAIDIAKAGDDYQTYADQIGITIEAYQELSYAAKLNDVSQEKLTSGLKNLNRSLGDAREGTGKLYTNLVKSNPELLKQLVLAKDTEDAFNISVKALDNAADSFEKASLASALFAGAGKDMLTINSQGAEGIQRLRKEALAFGVITGETAKNAGLWDDSQKRLNAAIEGTKIRLFSGLIPGLTEASNQLTNFLQDEEAVNSAIKIGTYVLAGVTAGLVTFLVVAKGAAIVDFLTKSFKALTVAVATNPIGALAVVLSTILVPAIMALNDAFPIFVNESENLSNKHKELLTNTDNLKLSVQEYKKANEELKTATKNLNAEETNTLNTRIKLAGLQIEADLAKTVKSLQQTRDAENQRIDTITKLNSRLKQLTNEEKDLTQQQKELNAIGFNVVDPGAISRVSMALESNAKAQQKANSELANANLEVEKSRQGRKETIDFLANSVNLNLISIEKIKLYNESIAKQVELRAQQLRIAEKNNKSLEDEAGALDELTDAEKELLAQIDKDNAAREKQITLSERLSILNNKEAVLQQENLKTFKDFLQKRIEQEKITGNARYAFLKSEYDRISKLDSLSNDEKATALKAATDAAKEIYKKDTSTRKEEHDKAKKEYEEHLKEEEKALEDSLKAKGELYAQYASAISSLTNSIASAFIAGNDAELEALREKYGAQTQSEIDYQNFLKKQKQDEVKNNLSTLEQLKSDLSSATDEETKIKLQQQITDLQNTITANDLQMKAEQDRAIQNEAMAKEERKIKRENAIATRIAGNLEIIANTSSAITKSYVANPLGFGLPWSAFYLGEGIARAIALNSAPLPPLQTGTPLEGFDIPSVRSSSKADNVAIMASAGENIKVTPRGESNGGLTEISININEDNIFKIINKGVLAGKIKLNDYNITSRRAG